MSPNIWKCPVCTRRFWLTKWGRVRAHKRCDGSRSKGTVEYPVGKHVPSGSETKIDVWTRRAEGAEHNATSNRALANSAQGSTSQQYREDIVECYEELAQFCRTAAANEHER